MSDTPPSSVEALPSAKPMLSSAQSLPWNVMEMIVNHRVETQPSTSDVDKSILFSILHTCHHWRAAFIRHCYKTVNIEICQSKDPYMTFNGWPNNICYPEFPFTHVVRTLNFVINPYKMSGFDCASSILLNSNVAKTKYPNAKNVVIKLPKLVVSDNYRLVDEPVILFEQVLRFICQIKSMASVINSLSINFDNLKFEHNGAMQLTQLRNPFAEALVDATSISNFVSCGDGFNPAMIFYNMSNLAHVLLHIPSHYDDSAELIRRNASTLRDITIRFAQNFDTSAIIYSDEGSPISYPLARSLSIRYVGSDKVNDADGIYMEPRYPNDSTVHFPQLRFFTFGGVHFFCGDAILRGTSATLERIDFIVSTAVMSVLESCNFFSVNRFPRLKDLQFRTYILKQDTIPTCRQHRFIIRTVTELDYLPYIHKLYMTYNFTLENFMYLVDKPNAFSSVQFINVLMEFDFSDMVSLLSKLPCLKTIVCSLSKSPPRLVGVKKADLLRYMATDNYPLNNNFTTLEISEYDQYGYNGGIIESIALLAIACPRFHSVNSHNNDLLARPSLSEVLLDDSDYTPYRSRLKEIKMFASTRRVKVY